MRSWTSGLACLAAVLASGCSFFTVKGPKSRTEGAASRCTDSDVIPSIDSAVGVLLIGGAAGGEVVTHATDHTLNNYELVLGLPLLVVGIVYLVSASHGTDRVEACQALKSGDNVGCDGCSERVP